MAFKSATSTLRPQRRLVAMHASPKVPEAASAESNPWGHIAGAANLWGGLQNQYHYKRAQIQLCFSSYLFNQAVVLVAGWSTLAIVGQAALVRSAWAVAATGDISYSEH
jgi:hypothetical protein